ncbi:endolytic transglycosylase MltG [Algoriphagus aquimarinus]|uniref:Endolytic murein transglycosylase n=1 Tax=Algoriphagus aquimarinus TaxID=237018 RepID=A0A5C7AW39_9BACT|nr:endolytic transglycosylase MltG [Algoriphagus aquimarinus]TXE12497.1 endolytic transglycosylase MltG [Algoriphagus aquimarinus]
MLSEKRKNIYLVLVIAFSVMAISLSFYFYQILFSPNALIDSNQNYMLKIGSNDTYKTVANRLYDDHVVNDLVSFSFLAKVLGYQDNVKPGLYTVAPKMTNLELIRVLRSGKQSPIRVTFNNVRTKEDLAEKITANMEISEEQFLHLIQDSVYIRKYNFNEETIMSMFVPNTYELWWNTSAEALFDRMYKEYESFWTDERKQKASTMGLNQTEVSTLASIVQAESQKSDERSRIAGVYLNRLKLGMPLQADPTLVFALGDFEIKRVLNVHKETDSPYNTYMYAGLPPGPINLPDINSLDAVLNAEDHSYLYFCAKEDFSGYHSFASTLAQHNANARRYQAALNAAKIY